MLDLRTYRAKSLAEALRLVREDLGPGASVLHTREVGSATWRWLTGGKAIEVTASNEVPSADEAAYVYPRADLHDFRSQFRRHLCDRRPGSVSVEDLAVHARLADDGLPVLLDRISKRLLQQQIPAQIVRSLTDELHEAARRGGLVRFSQLCQQLVTLIAGRLAVRGPIRILSTTRRVVALVGPSGVGKTTTLAKLAAGLHLREGVRVGLISTDSYRIAADSQLRTYAEIMNLPMEAVATADDLFAALTRFTDLDLVLIDTVGCSPRDATQMRQLAQMLDHIRPDETHLVLSSASSADYAAHVTGAFATVKPTALILTRLDEVTAIGGLWPLLEDRSLPVSYLAAGQLVPHDLQPASRVELATLIAGRAIADSAQGSLESA